MRTAPSARTPSSATISAATTSAARSSSDSHVGASTSKPTSAVCSISRADQVASPARVVIGVQCIGSVAQGLSCSIWIVTWSIRNSRAQSSAMASRTASSRSAPLTTACAERA